jgi:hypothetical protein
MATCGHRLGSRIFYWLDASGSPRYFRRILGQHKYFLKGVHLVDLSCYNCSYIWGYQKMRHYSKKELAETIETKQYQLLGLLEELQALIEHVPEQTRMRAEYYWLPHIRCAIKNDHNCIAGPMVTIDDTVDELREDG